MLQPSHAAKSGRTPVERRRPLVEARACLQPLANRAEAALPAFGLAFALAIGLAIRLRHVLAVGFPLNDGGLFYAMVQDIQASGYALPVDATYNNSSIPFAYPPFSFYLAALADDLSPLALIDVFRLLPLLANVLTIVAFFLVCRAMMNSRLAVAIAVPVFALLPRSYVWLIMGGGIARALGFLFALLAIHQAYLLFTTRRGIFAGSTALFAALTVLSHTETSWFLAFSLGLMWLCFGRDAAGVRHSVLVAAGVLALTSPWWITVVSRDGLAPFVAAAQTGGHTWDAWRAFLSWEFTEQAYVNWPAVLAIVGAVIALAQGRFFLPLWLAAIMLLDPRAGPTYATAPIAMLVGIAIAAVAGSLWRFEAPPLPMAAADGAGEGGGAAWSTRARSLLPKAAVGAFVLYLAVLGARAGFLEHGLLRGLDDEEREAMAQVVQTTPADSRFAVLTDIVPAWVDPVSEWFPALTDRASVATPQGYEWIGKDELDARVGRSFALQACARQGAACLDEWSRAQAVTFTHVYVNKDCCQALDASLRRSNGYTLVMDLPAAAVYEKLAVSGGAP